MNKSTITSSLRRTWLYSEERKEVKNAARVNRGEYQCEECKCIVGHKNINIHHIEPVIGLNGFVDWNTYIERLFCPKNKLQALCLVCHKKAHQK